MNQKTPSTVVITGASSGIGRELALEMARRGHHLGLTARRLPLLEQLREEIHGSINGQVRVELAALYVCQTASIAPTLDELFHRLCGIDTILFNDGVNDMTAIGHDGIGKQ